MAIQLRQQLRSFQSTAEQTLEVQARLIEAHLSHAESDLALLVGELLPHGLPGGINDGQRMSLERRLIAIADTRGLYDQLRFIDLDGREVVRIDYRPEGATSVSPERLQDKSDRYYVRIGLELQIGEIFISPLDLNIERKAIEQPLKPTIRLVGAVFDIDGNRRGMIVLNVLAAPLLVDVRRAGLVAGTPMLLNREGYWLDGPDPADEWAFMWPEKRDRSLAHDDPALWERISTENSGDIVDGDGAFTFATIGYRRVQPARRVAGTLLLPSSLPLTADDEGFKLVLFQPIENFVDHAQLLSLALIGFAVLTLTIILCLLSRVTPARPAVRPARRSGLDRR